MEGKKAERKRERERERERNMFIVCRMCGSRSHGSTCGAVARSSKGDEVFDELANG